MSDDVASAPELVWEYEGGRLRRARPDWQAKKTDEHRTARKQGSGDQRDRVLPASRADHAHPLDPNDERGKPEHATTAPHTGRPRL